MTTAVKIEFEWEFVSVECFFVMIGFASVCEAQLRFCVY